MISAEQSAEIRRLFYAEHWKVGTIAESMGVHRDAVKRVIGAESFLFGGGLELIQLRRLR
jgi:predicted DNA-binding protein YlxM (UPF0122 family)